MDARENANRGDHFEVHSFFFPKPGCIFNTVKQKQVLKSQRDQTQLASCSKSSAVTFLRWSPTARPRLMQPSSWPFGPLGRDQNMFFMFFSAMFQHAFATFCNVSTKILDGSFS